MRRLFWISAWVGVAALLAAGCSTGRSTNSAGSNVAGKADAGGGSAAAAGGGKQPATPALVSRALVRTAAITVRVGAVGGSADAAVRLATAQGGDVLIDRRAGTGRAATADLSLEVPPKSLEPDLSRLAALGEQVSRSTASTDVTRQVVDVNSRLSSMRTSLNRVKALYSKATSISAVIRLESEVTSREADLESLETQQLDLSRQTAYAKIDVHLRARPSAKPAPATKPNRHAALATYFGRGWHAFTTALRWVVAAVGMSLPFLLLLGAGSVAALWWRRRSARQRSARSGA